MADLPLLRNADPGRTLAWVKGQPISVEHFLASAEALASELPESSHLLNLCGDRYHFLLAFVAAMLRGQIVLLPANRAPQTLAEMAHRYSSLYTLYDGSELPPLELEAKLVTTYTKQPWSGLWPTFPANRLVAVVFTSGSTGEPQAQPKLWGALVEVAYNVANAMGLADTVCQSVVATVPPQHMYGLEASIMLPLQKNWVMHSGRPFFPADVKAALQQSPAPSLLVTTPIHLQACCEDSSYFPAVARVISATAALSKTLATKVEHIFQTEVWEIYGCSEAGSIATRRTIQGNRWRTLAGVSLQQQQAHCLVRAPYLPTEVVLSDLLTLHSDTTFALHGRQSDLVNIAGKRASLVELNRQLNAVDGVQDGAYFLPDHPSARDVTRMLAFVVAPSRSEQEILVALRKRVDEVFLPRPLYRVSSIPRSETGKLPRSHLVALAQKLTTQSECQAVCAESFA